MPYVFTYQGIGEELKSMPMEKGIIEGKVRLKATFFSIKIFIIFKIEIFNIMTAIPHLVSCFHKQTTNICLKKIKKQLPVQNSQFSTQRCSHSTKKQN